MCKILTKECANVHSINYEEYVQCAEIKSQNVCVNVIPPLQPIKQSFKSICIDLIAHPGYSLYHKHNLITK